MTGMRLAQACLLSVPLAALLPGGTPAHAQAIDMTQGGPIQVTAVDGIEWRQAEQMVIANGKARAVRAGVTVTADRLIAWYRRRGDAAASPAPASPAPVATGSVATGGESDTQSSEVYRLRAEGHVHIYTATDQAWGEQATYDLDQAVLVMTGKGLKLTTATDTLTARDTLEYWSGKRMAVARGEAVVITGDARRLAADTLVAFTAAPNAAPPSTPAPVPTRVAGHSPTPPTPAAPDHPGGGAMAAMSGRLEKVEAFDHVSVRTITDIVTGDRAVYLPDTGVARLGGHVRISRGMNQLNGSEAVVNMKTGIATLLAGETGRVMGLVLPNDPSNASLTRDAPAPVLSAPLSRDAPTREGAARTAPVPGKKPGTTP